MNTTACSWGFLPTIEVVTNLEHDHPDCYPTPGRLLRRHLRPLPPGYVPGGILLACSDDPGARRLLQRVAGRQGSTRSYGLDRSPVEAQPDYYRHLIWSGMSRAA